MLRPMPPKNLILATPRGFCAGVERAIEILDLAIGQYGTPVYVRNHIVHNTAVVADFERKGAIFVKRIDEIPDGATAVLSAHGSPPQWKQALEERNVRVIDAVCPLVTKVHREAQRYAREGYFILYLGHKGHPEPEGVRAHVPEDSFLLIEDANDAEAVMPLQTEKLIVLTQTTLSFDDTAAAIGVLQRRFPSLVTPPTFDICYATQNRQNAVKELLAQGIDVLLVVGSRHSSNSNRLRDVGERAGIASYLIDSADELEPDWLWGKTTLGLTLGASAPETLLSAVIAKVRGIFPGIAVSEAPGKKETAYFPLPKELSDAPPRREREDPSLFLAREEEHLEQHGDNDEQQQVPPVQHADVLEVQPYAQQDTAQQPLPQRGSEVGKEDLAAIQE